MVARVSTVAFEGIEARAVDVQVQVAPGLPAFAIVRTINLSFPFLRVLTLRHLEASRLRLRTDTPSLHDRNDGWVGIRI
jgi:hypothetical protein